jgi:hypothetical protein
MALKTNVMRPSSGLFSRLKNGREDECNEIIFRAIFKTEEWP